MALQLNNQLTLNTLSLSLQNVSFSRNNHAAGHFRRTESEVVQSVEPYCSIRLCQPHLAVTVAITVTLLFYKSLHRLVLTHLSRGCRLLSSDTFSHHLRSAEVDTCSSKNSDLLWRSVFHCRQSMAWISLPTSLRSTDTEQGEFKRLMKICTCLGSKYCSTLETLFIMCSV